MAKPGRETILSAGKFAQCLVFDETPTSTFNYLLDSIQKAIKHDIKEKFTLVLIF